MGTCFAFVLTQKRTSYTPPSSPIAIDRGDSFSNRQIFQPPVIVKILSHLGLPSRAVPRARRIKSI
jgi:hypothetical protein